MKPQLQKVIKIYYTHPVYTVEKRWAGYFIVYLRKKMVLEDLFYESKYDLIKKYPLDMVISESVEMIKNGKIFPVVLEKFRLTE